MTTAVQTTPTQSPTAAAFARAFDRAVAEKLVAFPNADGTWTCKSYTVTITDAARLTAMTCDCQGGGHVACKHRAVVAFARKHGVRPIRPVAAGVVAPSTAAEVALSERIRSEIIAEMARASYDLSHGSPEARLEGADAAIVADARYRMAEYDAAQFAASFRSPNAPAIY